MSRNTMNLTAPKPFVQSAFFKLICGETSVAMQLPPDGDALALTNTNSPSTESIYVTLGGEGITPTAVIELGYEINDRCNLILARPANAVSLAAIWSKARRIHTDDKPHILYVEVGTFKPLPKVGTLQTKQEGITE